MAVPKGIAVYCRAIDETIGEMRIHYAGFVHPFFGLDRGDGTRGTPLIFEVRGHDVDANLIHGEKMARMTFYRMSEDAVPDQDTNKQAYNEQTLKLSTFFGDWT
jgi:dCTP deaminase